MRGPVSAMVIRERLLMDTRNAECRDEVPCPGQPVAGYLIRSLAGETAQEAGMADSSAASAGSSSGTTCSVASGSFSTAGVVPIACSSRNWARLY